MNEAISQITTWGGVAAFVVLSGGLFLIWKDLGKRTDKLGTDLDGKIDGVDEKLGSKIDGADEKLGKRVGRVETRLGNRITRVETRISNTLFSLLGKGTLERHSPLHLNKLGREVSQEIDGEAWADQVLEEVKDQVADKDALGIQEFCFALVDDFAFTDAYDRAIRNCAFAHGLPTEQIRRVLAVELRDKLLKLADLTAP